MKRKMSLLTLVLSLVIMALPITAFASEEVPPPPPIIVSTNSHGSGGW
ncbi:MAG: hypothetical protein ACE3L7_33150 [Candidatus Pristimantibacillus sp.]